MSSQISISAQFVQLAKKSFLKSLTSVLHKSAYISHANLKRSMIYKVSQFVCLLSALEVPIPSLHCGDLAFWTCKVSNVLKAMKAFVFAFMVVTLTSGKLRPHANWDCTSGSLGGAGLCFWAHILCPPTMDFISSFFLGCLLTLP